MIGVGKSVNPFLLQMYFHISFNTWLNYSRRMDKRERHYLKQEAVRTKAIAQNKAFIPVEYHEEEELLVEVSVEIDEVIYYTSEEDVVNMSNGSQNLLDDPSEDHHFGFGQKSYSSSKKALNKRTLTITGSRSNMSKVEPSVSSKRSYNVPHINLMTKTPENKTPLRSIPVDSEV